MTTPTTTVVRAGIGSDQQHGAVVPPLHLSTTFTFAALGAKRPYDYTRSGNPTRDELGAALAALEGGAGAVVTSSGMAAVTLTLSLLEPGDLLVAPHDCYGGCYRSMATLAKKGHFDVDFVDQTDDDSLERALARRPKLVWVETPSNPLLRVVDVAAIVARAHAAGALVVVDNTFLSPALQRPIELGADIALHSTTKYINGHSDVVGGVVIAKTAELHEQLDWWGNCLGLTGAPFDSYLTLRGVRTLFARMRLHEENAGEVARKLAAHPAVGRVYYPGLADHPGHAIAARQQGGFGAMLSFELVDADGPDGCEVIKAFLDGLQCFSLAESLGGVESLIAHPATMTHASMDAVARRRAGISDALLRISVGIESAQDLVADLDRALERAAEAQRRLHGQPAREQESAGAAGGEIVNGVTLRRAC